MSDLWGPWIEHDGKGCPCIGATVQAFLEWDPGKVTGPHTGVAGSGGGQMWDWSFLGSVTDDGWFIRRIVRYRTRKPPGLLILESILADLPETVDA
jgi:hypothetical protein